MKIILGLKYSLFFICICFLWFVFIIFVDLTTGVIIDGVISLICGVVLASIITTYAFEIQNKRLLYTREIMIVVVFIALWLTIVNVLDWLFLTERPVNNPLLVIGNILAVQVIGTVFILFSFRGKGRWNK